MVHIQAYAYTKNGSCGSHKNVHIFQSAFTLYGLGPASKWAGTIQSLWNSSIHLWHDSEAVTVLWICSLNVI